MSGDLAQKVLARSIRHHPRKDGRAWAIRTVTATVAATLLKQAQNSYVDTPISPIVEVITEREAEYIGLNLRAGDLRLTVEGGFDITPETVLICDGETVDILKSDPVWHGGEIQQHKLYVHRRPEV